MAKMSRAGRMNEVHKILVRGYFKDSHAVFFVGDIAKKMGLKSSTYLKNICRDLCRKEFGVYMISTLKGDYFGYEPLHQVDFFDRVIVVNKQPVQTAEYRSWFSDAQQ